VANVLLADYQLHLSVNFLVPVLEALGLFGEQPHVHGHYVLVPGDRIAVHVVDSLDLFDFKDLVLDFQGINASGSGLHEHQNAVSENRNGGENNEKGEQIGANGVSDLGFGEEVDEDGRNNDSD
jgi:hypothetical protein